MQVAVIGSKGMLGQAIADSYSPLAEVHRLDLEEVDITDRSACLAVLTKINPDLIINSAAFVNVDTCETKPHIAWQVNVLGAQNVALAATQCAAELVYISTDYVFDGNTDSDYSEYDRYNPINGLRKDEAVR